MPDRRPPFFSRFVAGAALLCFGLNNPLPAQGQSTDTAQAVVQLTKTDSTVTTDTVVAEPPWYNLRKNGPPLTLHPRQVPKGEVDTLNKDDDFWYVSVGPGKAEPVKGMRTIHLPFWTNFLIWSLLAGALVAVFVVLIQSGNGESLFRRARNRRLLKTESEETALEVPPDLDMAIQHAISRGEFGQAVRLFYLRTLTNLGALGLIVPARDKPNREYLRELSGHPLHRDFGHLLRQYEYIFYGGFSMDEPTFLAVQEQYVHFQNRLDTL